MREKIWTFIGRNAGGLQWRILWVTQPKFIVGVSGLVRNEHGQVLLIKGRMWKPSRPWGLVTGYAKGGETWDQTVVREAREETGYVVKTRPEPVALVTGFKLRAEAVFLGTFIGGTYRPDPNVFPLPLRRSGLVFVYAESDDAQHAGVRDRERNLPSVPDSGRS